MPPSSTAQPTASPVTTALVHLGCARNLIDSELILARMAEAGCMVTGDPAEADVVVVNTCSFIGLAREESNSAIAEQLAHKRAGRIKAVAVAGCLVQRYKRQLQRKYPDVDLWAEISDYGELAKSIFKLGSGERVPAYLEALEGRGDEREGARLLATPGSYAYLRISHGCDHQCSFCAIPIMRGKHRSKRLPAVLAEAEELIGAGVRELVVVAEDSTAWGRDMDLELPDLVRAVADLDGEHQVRVMYAYPNRFPWGLTELLRDHPRVANYLDIPVQHIATPVLRAMRRHGSGDQVRRILDRLLEEVPDLTLRTTLLMGFPGETDADAAEAAAFVEEYRLGRLGAFTYSPEEGTTGFDLPGRVDPAVADERVRAVLAARDRVLGASQEALIGKPQVLLIDELHPAGSDAEPGLRAVCRPERDAPEVDLLALVDLPADVDIDVGDRIVGIPIAVDDELNLICEPDYDE
ncbi:MiaB/RimO family radical SAM methylthiotransferase [Engelhardtia mirabilis]|uniref:Ribosomal protein uS12 methylthiotransferase RimO n=1 Tax=Engelhardtia mirabilis TaxID=2528011 RepID=A0A518BRT2_9BACT|nr:Ribosomal protein S12 methylthiotransferase RimO [Planctomycetes bacterium Pla133]QDV04010.1 Ribosomal protein S12 methylthiotransferase RimO [Planctomycetes bacterium Pla86]